MINSATMTIGAPSGIFSANHSKRKSKSSLTPEKRLNKELNQLLKNVQEDLTADEVSELFSKFVVC